MKENPNVKQYKENSVEPTQISNGFRQLSKRKMLYDHIIPKNNSLEEITY